jgi:hypothetical protein
MVQHLGIGVYRNLMTAPTSAQQLALNAMAPKVMRQPILLYEQDLRLRFLGEFGLGFGFFRPVLR